MDVSSNSVVAWIEKAFDFVAKNKKQVLTGVVVVAILVVATVGYSFYRTHVCEQAHKALLQALKYYDGTIGKTSNVGVDSVVFASEAEKWQKTEQIFKDGYESYRGTELAPIFQAYQSEALLNQGKLDEAIKILRSAVDQIKSVPVKDSYHIKLALMMIDSSNELDKQQGLVDLKAIADSAQSVASESALYHLGAYYWSEKKFIEAKNYWQMLLVKYGTKDMKQPSQYVEIVKEKLALLSIESL